MPTVGAKGTFRQAGPLPPDVSTVMEQVKDQIHTDEKSREMLNNKAVGVIGAEESLRKRLGKLEAERKGLQIKDRPTSSTTTTPAPIPKQAHVTEAVKKSSKRESDTTPEKAESQTEVQNVDSPEWNVIEIKETP